MNDSRAEQPTAASNNSIFVNRIVLKNYKSIASCDVRFRDPLTILVGPNGAGKSNFLDAMRLVSDALRSSLDHALRDRSGIQEVRRRSGGHPTHFSIRLEFVLGLTSGFYSLRVGARKGGGFVVQEERCKIVATTMPTRESFFHVEDGRVVDSSIAIPPAVYADRLYLVTLSGLPEFRPIYDALSRMAFYNPNPQVIRDLQTPDLGELLARDGGNIASVLGKLATNHPEIAKRVEQYLEKVVPGVHGVERRVVGGGIKETLEFKQGVAGAKHPWSFPAVNMSDGTLRVLGILVALFQAVAANSPTDSRIPLVGIEEPETALNPGAAGVLLDSLRDASRATQVLITSHSPDLLNDKNISPDSILAVFARNGETIIGPLNSIGRQALNDHLYTVGELLRLNQLEPELEQPALLVATSGV
jgi:predicted ATPase